MANTYAQSAVDAQAIIKSFIINAPPGQVKKVAEDCELLETVPGAITAKLLAESFEQYNENECVIVTTADKSTMGVVGSFGRVSPSQYLLPRTKQLFQVDHKKQRILLPLEPANETHFPAACEPYRLALEAKFLAFEQSNKSLNSHYKDSLLSSPLQVFTSVYAHNLESENEYKITAVRSSQNISLSNYWSGASYSIWEIRFTPRDSNGYLNGLFATKLHHFEQGNTQGIQKQTVEKYLEDIKEPEGFAHTVYKTIGMIETELFNSLDTSLVDFASSQLRGLRRLSPLNKKPFTWDIQLHCLQKELNTKHSQLI